MNRRFFLVSVAAVPAVVSAGCATSLPGGQKAVHVVVAGASYPAAPPEDRLPNASLDAIDVAAVLRDLGHDVDLLIEPDYDMLTAAFDRIDKRIRPGEHVLFYFAGHGVQDAGVNYLVMSDLNRTLVPVPVMLEWTRSRAASVTMVLDACRNNPFEGKPVATDDLSGMRTRSQDWGPDFRPIYPRSLGNTSRSGLAELQLQGGGVKAVFSTDPNNVAVDGDVASRNSPFARAFIRNIRQQKSLDEVVADVTREVAALTNGRQTPWQQGSIDQVLFLAGAPTSLSSGRIRPTLP